MGGMTMSNNPSVIRRFERDRARSAVERQVRALHEAGYPYQGDRPTGAQIDATITAISFLLGRGDTRPMVLAALGLDEQ